MITPGVYVHHTWCVCTSHLVCMYITPGVYVHHTWCVHVCTSHLVCTCMYITPLLCPHSFTYMYPPVLTQMLYSHVMTRMSYPNVLTRMSYIPSCADPNVIPECAYPNVIPYLSSYPHVLTLMSYSHVFTLMSYPHVLTLMCLSLDTVLHINFCHLPLSPPHTLIPGSGPDINECLEGASCPNNSVCMNTNGTYLCQCNDGYSKNSNGTCERK